MAKEERKQRRYLVVDRDESRPIRASRVYRLFTDLGAAKECKKELEARNKIELRVVEE